MFEGLMALGDQQDSGKALECIICIKGFYSVYILCQKTSFPCPQAAATAAAAASLPAAKRRKLQARDELAELNEEYSLLRYVCRSFVNCVCSLHCPFQVACVHALVHMCCPMHIM